MLCREGDVMLRQAVTTIVCRVLLEILCRDGDVMLC